jgi:hypothetical protein
MSLFETYATNRRFEAEGIWIDCGGGTQMRIARRNRFNKRYRKMIDSEVKPYQSAIKQDNLDPDIDARITTKVFCHTILLGWKGVKEPKIFTEAEHDDDGFVGYTPERGIKLMEALPDLYDMLGESANKASNFRDEQNIDDAKN